MSKQTDFTCSKCSAAWRKSGSTNCWSTDPVSVLYGQNFYYKRLQKQPVLQDD